jgi:hypothetical protein
MVDRRPFSFSCSIIAWLRAGWIRHLSLGIGRAGSGIEFGHQPVQIQPIPLGHLPHGIEQRLAADALSCPMIPRLEYRLGCPVTADNLQYRHPGFNARQPLIHQSPDLAGLNDDNRRLPEK